MRRSEGRAARFGRSDRIATLCGATAAALVVAAAVILEVFRYGPALTRLEVGAREVAAAIGRAVANDVERAAALGIPLDRMVGVVPYLDGIREANPSVSALAVEDAAGRVLFASPAEGALADAVATPLVNVETTVGAVLVMPSDTIAGRVRDHLRALGGAFALLTGLALGIVVRLWRLERIDLPEARFVAGGRAVARGAFADYSVPRPGPFTALGQAAARLTGPVRRSHRRLLSLSDEVTALDVAGRYRARIAAVHASLRDLSFDRAMRRRMRERALVWWPLLALTAGEATRLLGASFAADRVLPGPVMAAAISAAIGAGAAGGLVGLALAALLAGRAAKLTAFVGLLVAAGANAAVFATRDLNQFIALEAAAGAGLWLAVLAVGADARLSRRRPFQAALLLLAGLAVGPILGAVAAEAAGRRAAYLMTGGTLAAVALLLLATASGRALPRRRAVLRATEVAALAAAGLALTAWADIHLSVVLLREDYAGLAFHAGVLGTAMLLPAALGATAPPVLGAVLAAGALGAGVLVAPPGAAISAAIGLGLGVAVHALGWRGFSGAAVAAILAGSLLAAAAMALPSLAPETTAERLGGRELAALAAALLAAVSLLTARR
jgi:hypothetical protein